MDWLQKVATGWLKWRPKEFEYALIPDIIMAYEGYMEELKAIHGSSEKKDEDSKEFKTADDFRAAFAHKGFK